MPDLAKIAFDDPSGRSNPRMPLVSELIELFWRPTTGEARRRQPVYLSKKRLMNGCAYEYDDDSRRA